MEKSEKIEVYLRVYTSAIRGWLSNKYAASNLDSMAEDADKLADNLAKKALKNLEKF